MSSKADGVRERSSAAVAPSAARPAPPSVRVLLVHAFVALHWMPKDTVERMVSAMDLTDGDAALEALEPEARTLARKVFLFVRKHKRSGWRDDHGDPIRHPFKAAVRYVEGVPDYNVGFGVEFGDEIAEAEREAGGWVRPIMQRSEADALTDAEF